MTVIRALWETQPVRVTALLASLVVLVAAQTGVVVDEATITDLLALVLPILLGGEIARRRVAPYAGEPGLASDDQPDTPTPGDLA